ncbi:Hypothetical protein NocV09_02700290 [Nannochloropsis oceanica]
MSQNWHLRQQRQRLLNSLPAAPARLFIKLLHSLPLEKGEREQEVKGGESGSSIDPAKATCRTVLGSRHMEEIRCLGTVVKHDEVNAGLWLDDGTGVVYVQLDKQALLPAVGELCEVVGPMKLVGLSIDRGNQQQQPQISEVHRIIAAQRVFIPQDPNFETAFTLSTIDLFRTVYLAHTPPLSLHETPSSSAPPSPSLPLSSSLSSSSASIDGMILSHILHLQSNGKAFNGVGVQALQGLVPSLPELEASLSRLQMEGLVYCMQGRFYPL